MATETEKLENSLGIPRAIFLEDVEKFMKEDNKSAEDVIKKLDELYQKYRLMEVNLLQKKEKLKTQIPDIKMSLGKILAFNSFSHFKSILNPRLSCWFAFSLSDMVKLLKQNNDNKKTVETDFILAHNLYARAEIPPTDRVSSRRLHLVYRGSWLANIEII